MPLYLLKRDSISVKGELILWRNWRPPNWLNSEETQWLIEMKTLLCGEGFKDSMMKKLNWQTWNPKVTPNFYPHCPWIPEAKQEWRKHTGTCGQVSLIVMTAYSLWSFMLLGDLAIFLHFIWSPRVCKTFGTMCPSSSATHFLFPTVVSADGFLAVSLRK